MLKDVVVVRSSRARQLFLVSAAITVTVSVLANDLSVIRASNGLAPIFKLLFSVGDYAGATCALIILLASALFTPGYSPRPLLRWVGLNPMPIVILCAGILSIGTWLIYQNARLSMDEYAQFFQSQIFASGHLSGRFPLPLMDWLIPSQFQNYFLNVSHTSGEVSSGYWPSFALMLTPFTWLGIPWACNPLISALTLLAIHRLTMRIFNDTETAGLAVLLTLASPVFFGNGISYYSMPAHLLANSVYALLLVNTTPRRAFAAGVIGALALTIHNPVPHTLFAAPWIISMMRRPTERRSVVWLLVGYLPLFLLLGGGWLLFSSHLSHEGAALAEGTSNFGDTLAGLVSIVTPPTASILLARIVGVAKIWAWSVPGLMLLACYGAWKWRHDRWCFLFFSSATLTLLMYAFIPVDQGHGWGYRYFHSAWMALPILGAAAFKSKKESRDPVSSDNRGGLAFVVTCALLSLVFANGLRALQMRDFILNHESHQPQYAGQERRILILDPRFAFYGYDAVQNDPWLRGSVVRMITHGKTADAQMMADRFPDMHQVYADKYGTVWSAK